MRSPVTGRARVSAFTLIEVAVASSLIAFSVLSAMAIIPQGLKAQHHARMKAVAAAAAVRVFATNGGWDGRATANDPKNGPVLQPFTGTITRVVPDATGNPPETPVAGDWRHYDGLAADDLANRLVFTFRGGGTGVHTMRAWELRAEAGGLYRADYLASFTYYMP